MYMGGCMYMGWVYLYDMRGGTTYSGVFGITTPVVVFMMGGGVTQGGWVFVFLV